MSYSTHQIGAKPYLELEREVDLAQESIWVAWNKPARPASAHYAYQ